MKKLLHLAIIPDANRRWARKRGLKPWEGHEAGAKNLEKILEAAKAEGIKFISFWGSSEDNLEKRPFLEKRALLDIYERYFKKLIESPNIHQDQVRINVLGEWESQFPPGLKKIIKETIKKTAGYQKFFLNFFLAYSGDKEMERAIIKVAEDFKLGMVKKITPEVIKNRLLTKDLPPVDLLIRTGSTDDPHFSTGFMMWDTKDAQLFFSPKEWPGFKKSDLTLALKSYYGRFRRYGS
jgi:undecaprenyl diphosphate synthase